MSQTIFGKKTVVVYNHLQYVTYAEALYEAVSLPSDNNLNSHATELSFVQPRTIATVYHRPPI